MTDSQPVEPPADRFCHNCGAPNAADYSFCLRCGARINFLRPLPRWPDRLPGAYPVRFDVEYPQKLSRLLIFVKWWLLAIPQLLIVYALSTVASVVGFIAWFAILFTKRYPKGLFELVVGFNRWGANVTTYTGLLRDEYPPFSTEQGRYPARYEVDYPEKLSRWLIFVKWLIAIPHAIVLQFLFFIAFLFWFIAWFGILFTGRFPRGLFNFIVGVMRWNYRVGAYTSLLRDEFPPYSLSAEAGPASGRAAALSAVGAVLLVSVSIGGIVALSTIEADTKEVQVRYADVLVGISTRPVEVDDNYVVLLGADDPASVAGAFRQPRSGHRFVRFDLEVTNVDALFTTVSRDTFELKDTRDRKHQPLFVEGPAFEGELVERGRTERVGVLFELRNDADPSELTYSPGFAAFFPIGERVRFEFNGETDASD